ncbi:MAG TPA: hypothetical protein VM260_02935 [Pirellula sp.]|nr:hypothetical protein [Pirellula sp.]
MNTAQTPGSGNQLVGIGKLLSNPTFQASLGILILLAVCWLAFYVMSRLRESNAQDIPLHDLVKKNFEEMRSGGDISETEFRKITSLLAEKAHGSNLSTQMQSNTSHEEDSDEKSL